MTTATPIRFRFPFLPLRIPSVARGIVEALRIGFATPSPQDQARLFFRRGICFYWLGFHEESIAEFRKILRLNWRDEKALLWIEKSKRAQSQALQRLAAASRQGIVSDRPITDWIS